eukprot:TRINITY_DN8739_c0_g2_i10.p1 TRINITY_DN8739_c0_g2~~TRINITY_DN8739_c0_g2_i10.p1  ORF type:complete len:274 (+),score=80.14 TRINITY_DN8739_c0_g2_i10:97-918(+)
MLRSLVGSEMCIRDRSGCNPEDIARKLQDSCYESPSDVAYALRALEVARSHPRVALQAVKLIQLIAFKFPNERLHITRQVLGSLLATLELHMEDEFVAGCCCSTLKFLTDGACDGRERGEWPGECASPCSPTNKSQRFELTPARMLHEAGAEPIIERALRSNEHNEFLVADANRALDNIRFGTVAFDVADIDGDGVLDDEELLAFQKLADVDGDGTITLEEVEEYGKQLLKSGDLDGDGMIDADELSHVVHVSPRSQRRAGGATRGGKAAPSR